MERLDLRYGCNPDQKGAYVFRSGGLPAEVLNGHPGYINLLDALEGWQLVRELRQTLALPAAASFKHVSPAGAAVAVPLDERERRMYFVQGELSPLAASYARARGADRMSSFGDFIALSDVCDVSTASLIAREVSDGIIAPGYDSAALDILKAKKNGRYVVLRIDPDFVPEEEERRTIFGITFSQPHNGYIVSDDDLQNIVTERKDIPPASLADLKLALTVLKYTQSNSVCLAWHGQTIGVGAGQQSRIHCTRLASDKADRWQLRRSDRVLSLPFLKGLSRNAKDNAIEQYLSDDPEIDVLDCWQDYFSARPEPFTSNEKREYLSSRNGVALASDAFFPFSDNIIRASRSGVSYIVQPGGSIRDDIVVDAADECGIVMCMNPHRLFHH